MSTEDRQDNRQEPGRLVRPYAMTGGRTRPADDDLELETLLCRDILSIAEISARLDLPLGVVRVLVGDMAEEGLVTVHRPASVGDRPDLALLERVLYGLRTI
jgi:hypothetical protein